MDLFTFLSSAASLFPYFQKCVALGLSFSLQEAPPDKTELFSLLRLPGKLAENQMLLATGSVNTHKGAVFSMGILCAAIGAQSFENRKDPKKILQTCGEMTRGMVSRDLKRNCTSHSGASKRASPSLPFLSGEDEPGIYKTKCFSRRKR